MARVADLLDRFTAWRERHRYNDMAAADLADVYRTGDARERKDATLYALQLAQDARLDGETAVPRYDEIQDAAIDHTLAYYADEDPVTAPTFPDTEKRTKPFWLQQYCGGRFTRKEDLITQFVDELDYEVDAVIGIASGGTEPAILAADRLDTDLGLVRFSHERRDDTDVSLLDDTVAAADSLLLIDDVLVTGYTLYRVWNAIDDSDRRVHAETVTGPVYEGLEDSFYHTWIRDRQDV